MREINVNEITNAVSALCIKANKVLPSDLTKLIVKAAENENTALACSVMNDLILNLDAAKKLDVPVCQDCGMAVIFINIGIKHIV